MLLLRGLLRYCFGAVTIAGTASVAHDQVVHKKPAPSNPPIPTVDATSFPCSSEWLAEILKVPAEDIKGIQTKPLTGGCTGPVLHRIFIETTNPKNPVPKSLIAKYCEISKLPPRDMSERFFSFLQAPDKFCRKEVTFYQEMQNQLAEKGINTPKCFWAAFEDAGRRSPLLTILRGIPHARMLLVLEDLGDKKNIEMGKFLDEEDGIEAVKALARLHAQFWNKPRPVEIIPNVYDVLYGVGINKYAIEWKLRDKKFARNFVQTWKNEEMLQPLFLEEDIATKLDKLVKSYRLVKPFHTHSRIQNSDLFQNTTLLHGDYHSGNIFFDTTQKDRVHLCDWQAFGYGHGTSELAYFLGFSIKFDPDYDKKVRNAYYEELTGDFGKGVLVPKEEYPRSVFERESLLREVSLAASFSALIALDNPENRKKRNASNEKAKKADEELGPVIQNLTRRGIHHLETNPQLIGTY